MQTTTIPELVDEAHACRILGGETSPIHRSSLWRGINAGRFPKPLKIGQGTNRWRRDELVAFLDHLMAARDRGQAA
jgi:predicted DNA-binding transcriptional regulator AlpA